MAKAAKQAKKLVKVKAAKTALPQLAMLPEAGAALEGIDERGKAAQVLLAVLEQQVSVAWAVYRKLAAKDYQRFSNYQWRTSLSAVSLEFLDGYYRFKRGLSRGSSSLGRFLQATVEGEELVLSYRGSSWRCPLWLLTASSWEVAARTRALYREAVAQSYREYPAAYREAWSDRVGQKRMALAEAERRLDQALRELAETQKAMVETEPQVKRLVEKRLATLGAESLGEPPTPQPRPVRKMLMAKPARRVSCEAVQA